MYLYSFLFYVAFGSQTWYEKRKLLELYVANDGRIEGYVAPPHDEFQYIYRNFLNINPNTGELMLAFNVAKDSLREESHIMTSNLGSGAEWWDEPLNATSQPPGYIHDNMVLWWDDMEQAMVMLYQSSSYTYWASVDPNWEHNTDLDAYDQRVYKKVTYDMGQSWTEAVHLLHGVDNPHVHYQIIEALDVDEDGNPTHVLVPVHHLSEGVINLNWQMVYRTTRDMPELGEWEATNMSSTPDANLGFIQSSIVRTPDDKLVAFLRDCNGWWARRSVSVDDGRSWSDPIPLPIPNPDAMSQAIALRSGWLFLAYNPQQSFTSEPAPGDRYSNSHHLVVALSNDYGMTWQYSLMLEYAYDGMFNYPVAVQDPTCDNILLSYSVMTRMSKGCALLPVCSMAAAGTQQYIKFTVLNEDFIRNQYDWSLDTSDACTWQISESLAAQMPLTASATAADTDDSSSTTAKAAVITLACILGAVVCGNLVWFITWCRKPSYARFDEENFASGAPKYATTMQR